MDNKKSLRLSQAFSLVPKFHLGMHTTTNTVIKTATHVYTPKHSMGARAEKHTKI
jgi:hypothetical protein